MEDDVFYNGDLNLGRAFPHLLFPKKETFCT